MKIKKAEFVTSAVKKEQYPSEFKQDIAFVGRSNAGKSSLLNALTNRKNLAKHGKTPGVTALVNFFNINDTFYLVDLPGYGYAQRSKVEKAKWSGIINTYLEERPELGMVVQLVDIRHAPSKEDCMMYDWIRHSAVPHIVIASKSDKINRSQTAKCIKQIRDVMQIPGNITVLPVSSLKKTGLNELWERAEDVLFGSVL